MTASHTRVGLIGACLLGILLTSCGGDSAGTVDRAVTLLQDLNDRNVWETIADRLITLNDQTSYRAIISLESGAVDAGLKTDLLLEIEVDDRANARVVVTENGITTTCVTTGEQVDLLQSVFNRYRIDAFGMQTLAVVDRTKNEDAVIAERAAIEYDLKSKVSEALDIASEFENNDLQAALDQARQFELGGDLYLDKATLALLRVTSLYTDLAAGQSYKLSFAVTQWGDIADIAIPTDIAACGFSAIGD